jgi:hypothetical protein
MIWNVFALSAARYLFRLGLAPKGAVIRRALSALRKDNLDLAVNSYFDLAKRDFSSEKVQVLREILISEISYRKKLLLERIENLKSSSDMEEAKRQREIDGCQNAIKILDEYLGRLGVGMRDFQASNQKE